MSDLIRTRARYHTPPPFWGYSTPAESFTDSPVPSKTWKACVHNDMQVVKCLPHMWQVQFRGYPVPDPYIATFPLGLIGSPFQGIFQPDFEELNPIELQSIDLGAKALEMSRSSSNVAEIIATMKDTAKALVQPWSFFNHLKKTNFRIPYKRKTPLKELRASIDAAASTWLQGTYGYIPLISDLIELSQVARHGTAIFADSAKPFVEKIYQSSSTTANGNRAEASQGLSNAVYTTGTRTTELSRMIHIHWDVNPAFFTQSMFQQLSSYLGLQDYGRLAWELVPYSFVLDWFTDVGSSISHHKALNGPLMYVNGSVSSWTKTTTETSIVSHPPDNLVNGDYRYIPNQAGVAIWREIHFERSHRGEGSVDGVLIHNGLNAYRTASGIALLCGRVSSVFGRIG